jgi:PAS domain S-box-containing protein
VLPNLLVFAACFAGGKLGLSVPFTSGNVSPVWPPAGIALAAVVIWGYGILPGVAAAAFLVNLLSPISAAAALGISLGTTVSTATARRLWEALQLRRTLERLRDVLGLFVIVLGAPLFAAAIGNTALRLARLPAWGSFAEAVFVWWLGDAMGMLVLAPLLLNAAGLVHRRRWLELMVLLGALFFATLLVFDHRVGPHVAEDVLAFTLFPFIVWAALRFGVAGSALTSTLVAVTSVYYTAHNLGPFTHREPLANAVLLQVFLAVISATGLILAAVVQERHRAVDELDRDRKLRESEAKFRAVAETAATAIYIHDGTRLLYLNPAVETITGYTRDELIAHDMWSIVHPEDMDQVRRNAVSRFRGEVSPARYEYRIIAKDGSIRWLDFGGSLVEFEGKRCILATALDITERKQAEHALRVSDKLATVGRMAASIAHEINNPLESVTNLLYLIYNHPALSEEVRPLIGLAQTEMERVAHVARQTLAFYREPASPAAVRMDELLEDVLRLYAAKLKSAGVTVERRYDTQQSVAVLAGELRQVFSNLLLNAVDAMEGGGCIHLRVRDTRNTRTGTIRGVVIFVQDSGSGIARAHLRSIFEPFFTTKGTRGTGLGLWVSKGIVEKHGGTMAVRSSTAAGRSGTCFRIFLPLNAGQAAVTGLDQRTVA